LEIQESMWPEHGAFGWLINFFWLGVGGVALFAGSNMLIEGVMELALLFGVWEGVIGLTVVAVGTSLPELATVVVAAWRRHPEIVIGGIIGSNIFNILAVLGVTALVAPVDINRSFLVYDMWVMLGAILIVIPFFVSDWRLGRLEASVVFIGYMAYVASLYSELIIVD
jgi:cation:H+ antiporter